MAGITIRKGFEYSATAYRRTGPNNTVVVPIPGGMEARMLFTPKYADMVIPWTLTSNPPAGLTIDYPDGSIAIYMGATFTSTLEVGTVLCWVLEIYDPLNPDVVVFLGKGDATVSGC